MPLIDSYSESNQSAGIGLAADSYIMAGQSFTGSEIYLASAKFYLKKTGTPPGECVAKLYAHSGTFGSTSVGTGDALAISDSIVATTLGTSYTLVTFTFSTPYALINATKYVIVCEYNDGSISNNYISMGSDNSSPSHGGNRTTYSSGSWEYLASQDVCFYVYGITKIYLEADIRSQSFYNATMRKEVNLSTNIYQINRISTELERNVNLSANINQMMFIDAILRTHVMDAIINSMVLCSAEMKVVRKLYSTVNANVSFTAAIKRDMNLQTSVLGHADLTAYLLYIKNLSAEIRGMVSMEGDVMDANEMFATINSLLQMTADMKVTRNMQARINNILNVTANLRTGTHIITLENAE